MGEIYPEDEGPQQPKKSAIKPSSILDLYGTNISKAATEDRLDPVVGRVDEISRMIQILGRKRKNNPVLVGEPGTGKCVSPNTKITVRNIVTGEVQDITIEQFKKIIKDDSTF